MKYQIRCEAIKEFDHQRGQYLKCNQLVDVDSSQMGMLVTCPTCGSNLEVIDPALVSSGELNLTAIEADQVDDSDETVEGNDTPVSSMAESHVDLPGKPSTRTPNAQTDAPDNVRRPSQANSDSRLSDLKKETWTGSGASVLHPTRFHREEICHQCGTLLEEKQPVCQNCQTPRRAPFVEKKDRKPFSKKGPFGFQLWLQNKVSTSGQPGELSGFSLLVYAFSVATVGTGAWLVIFGGLLGIMVGLPVAGVGFAIFSGMRFWDRAMKNPRASLPLLWQVAWVLMLFVLRRLHFSRLSEDRSLKHNGDASFGDEGLKSLRNLGRYKVIDLEGTSVSDEGLLYLHDLRGIQFLVVRNTNVTETGVFELQQTVPKTWIWS